MARRVRNSNRVDLNADDIMVLDSGALVTAEDLESIIAEIVGNQNTIASDLGTAEGNIGFISDMLSGDMTILVDPETLGSSATTINAGIGDDGFTRDVSIELQNTDGDALVPFNGTLPVDVATSSNGSEAADIDNATTVTFVNGVASITINYTGTWVEADTCTLTVGDTSTILGYSVADATSVDTVIA
jgi:hypothetical protein